MRTGSVPLFATLTVRVPVSPVKNVPGSSAVLLMATRDPEAIAVSPVPAVAPVLVPMLVPVLVLLVGTASMSAAANGATTAHRSRQSIPAPSTGQCLWR